MHLNIEVMILVLYRKFYIERIVLIILGKC